jgi:zinc transporter, ZIP family
MIESFVWGAIAASSLVLGALLAMFVRIGRRTIGLIMAFGSGVLVSAVAFDLVEEASTTAPGSGVVIAAGLFAGCLTFFVGDLVIDRMGGEDRKAVTGEQGEGSPLAIVLGTVLDGVPESMVIGLTLLGGGAIGISYLTAVFISNLPEAIASTTGLVAGGWSRARVLGLWLLVALISGLAALAGFRLFDTAPREAVAFVLAFAGGAILTMLADTMVPEAYEHAGPLTGVATTIGFAIAYGLHIVE